MLQGRLFSYPDTHRHRVGPNSHQIPINCPYRARVSNMQRDGFMTVDGNQGNKPNYEPNSFGGPSADPQFKRAPYKVTGLAQRFTPNHPNSDYAQPGALFRKVMAPDSRKNLIDNIVGHMKNANREIQERQAKIFYKCDPEYGSRIAEGLGFPIHKSKL